MVNGSWLMAQGSSAGATGAAAPPKLRRITLIHFGRTTFRYNFGKTRKLTIFMVFWFWNVSMTPQTNYVWLWTHRITPKASGRKPKSFLGNIIWGNLEILNIEQAVIFWKDGGRKILKMRMFLESLEYGMNIFRKTWNRNLVIWNQYRSKNMKWQFSNMGLISIEKHETKI